ncbi:MULTISPECIES: glycosyltransferase family 25 protein [Acinetobacter]|jgi:glycosyl transferase family 25|uniref:Glycosyltransferase family 25 protein n=1 Tax=Acinetobacter bereziniae TaxID=106648 RepID=A0A0A8TT80_ACIBZ|nr:MULTISPECIES: glycosyltransferase family 25 protein [Acinetobacter]MEC8122247.1 glycosyltransferase family 25 protein [Pseudomonadota bacterium]KKW75823.1 glycosyl transferase [Acinetobacter sp. Ag2]MBI0393412.1 glycosyltransferase family 25 protein [Acinetobacter bereziniae]MBJ8422099.1 glycosyltransferase family 25 protein [Acinetobacter bereziniae]MBJ9371111.1 glycosyltransferase family 25 protein [Acinetobacter sp. TGL-Y2]
MKVETYLINLDGSDERLQRATEQLQAVDWSFQRFSAYDGRGQDLASFENYDDVATQQTLGRRLLNSELGCYLSHYGCAEKFLQTDADYLVVLEDDMKITTDFKTSVEQILSYLDQHQDLDWYLINLAAKKKKFAKDIVKIDDFSLWHAYYFPIRGLGLIWSRKGAEAFVASGKTMTMPVDIFFQTWLSKNGKGLGVWPALVKPAGLDSDILGTVATQGISRKEKENRDSSYGLKKQKRMWRDRMYAFKHLYF